MQPCACENIIDLPERTAVDIYWVASVLHRSSGGLVRRKLMTAVILEGVCIFRWADQGSRTTRVPSHNVINCRHAIEYSIRIIQILRYSTHPSVVAVHKVATSASHLPFSILDILT